MILKLVPAFAREAAVSESRNRSAYDHRLDTAVCDESVDVLGSDAVSDAAEDEAALGVVSDFHTDDVRPKVRAFGVFALSASSSAP